MAKPIKETPVLQGKDAVNFFQKMEESSNKKASQEEIKRIQRNAEKLRGIAQF